MSEGDYHIFINTLLFNNDKYKQRYNIELTKLRSVNQIYKSATKYPNMLARLFCHWRIDMRSCIHYLLIYKIITMYVIRLIDNSLAILRDSRS